MRDAIRHFGLGVPKVENDFKLFNENINQEFLCFGLAAERHTVNDVRFLFSKVIWYETPVDMCELTKIKMCNQTLGNNF